MIGTRIADRYEVLAELGRGGMGVVYRARDTVLGREVALKLVAPALLGPHAEERLRREAEAVARMDHPSIVVLYDVGRHEGSLFLLMPVVAGISLRALLSERALKLAEVLEIGIQVAEALDYAHAQGVVHRDIKPENIMVAREGEALRVRVMDFGLARSHDQGRLTSEGVLVGTLTYLSPEQVRSSDVDARSDIYSLGAVLYECLTGEPPFSGAAHALLFRIAYEDPRPPRLLGAEIDVDLELVLLRCLSKHVEDRPARAGELAAMLRHYREHLDQGSREKVVASFATSRTLLAAPPSPFVGRQDAMRELLRRLGLALAGECQLTLVSGEAGIGKRRLLEELERGAGAQGIRVLHGRFAEKDQAFAYQGFCDVIQDSFRSARGSTPVPVDFSDLAADLVALFPVLGEVPGIRQAVSGASHLDAAAAGRAENKTQVFELLARAVARIAAGRPLVLLLENLHGAEESIEALAYVVRRLGPTPLLVVGTYRPSELEKRHPLLKMIEAFEDDPRFGLVTLGPLSPAEHRALIESLLGGAALAPDLVDKLFEATEGNPHFTKELVRSLVDSGGIVRDGSGVARLGLSGISVDALPQTIQQAVARRVARLPEELRDTLTLASVLGRSFELRDLETLAEERPNLEDVLERLLLEGLLEEERQSRGDHFSFSSAIVRDVLYAALPRRKRRALHRRCAEQLERRHAGRLERVYPQLVHHFSQADVADKTVEYGLRLAKACLDAFSPEDALRALRTALEYVEDEAVGPGLEAEARLLAARAHRMQGDTDAALSEAEAAVQALPSASAAAALFAAETAWQARRIEEARRWVERGLAAARAAGETTTLSRLLMLAATVANLRGDYAEGQAFHDEAERLRPAASGEAEPLPSGGRLVVALVNPVRAAEPCAIATVDEEEVLLNVFETLLGTDAEGSLVPCLCERWEAREGGGVFVLSLRNGVRFHDGHSLTAGDVKAALQRAVRVGPVPPALAGVAGATEYAAGSAEQIAGLVPTADHVLEVRLEQPLPIFPALLSDAATAVCRQAEGGLVGTGPFRLASRSAERIVLERHPDHWREAARLDSIEFRVAPSAAAIAAALRSGEVDLARDLQPRDLEAILRDPRLRRGFVEVPKHNTYFVVFHCGSPLGRDPNLRHALAGVVRAHDIVYRALGPFAQPATGLIPPGILGHDPGRRREGIEPQQAQAWLREAGLPVPLRLRAAVHPILRDRYGTLTRALFDTWAALGVEVEVTTPDMEAFLAAFESGTGVDVLLTRWNADYPDPDSFTHGLFHSRGGRLRAYFSAPDTDRLAEQARSETRGAVRESLYRQLEERLLETSAVVPLFHDIDYRVAGPSVLGLRLSSTPPYVNYAELARRAPTLAPALAPVRGVLHVPLSGSLTSLDPALTWSIEQVEVIPNVFETLTRDVGGARAVPWLASHVDVEEDGRSYRIRLRDDVRFHDGRRLTARDVRYSYERLLTLPDAGPRRLLEPICGARELIEGGGRELRGLHVLSSSEIVIELEEPLAFFPVLLSYPATAIVPEGSHPAAGSWREGCVGTGPFRVTRFEPDKCVELERHPGYWRAGCPKSESLVFHVSLLPEKILEDFRAGRLSLASDLRPADVEELRHEFAAGYREAPRLSTYFLAFNARRGPMAEAARRRRLAESVDADALVARTIGRLAVPAHGLIPPGLLGYEAGHRRAGTPAPAGVPTTPTELLELRAAVHPVFHAGHAALARELWDSVRVAGLAVRPASETLDEYLKLLGAGDVDLVLGRWNADYPDADTFMVGLLHSREGLLGELCGSPEIDRLVERGRSEPDPLLRHALYRSVEQALVRDVRVLPLFHEQVYRFARPEVEGLALNFSLPVVAYEELSLRG